VDDNVITARKLPVSNQRLEVFSYLCLGAVLGVAVLAGLFVKLAIVLDFCQQPFDGANVIRFPRFLDCQFFRRLGGACGV